MAYSSFIKKMRWLAGIFLLCMSVVCVYDTSSVHAQDFRAEGVSGTCIWKYEPLSTDNQRRHMSYRLIISPSPKRDFGELGHWGEDLQSEPPWRSSKEHSYCSLTTHIEIKDAPDGKRPVKARTCLNMFRDFTALTSIDLSGLDVTGVADMRKMFLGCRQLTSLNLKGWDTSSVTTMSRMFAGCSKLSNIDGIESWDTSNVVDMCSMFRTCSSLTMLDLSGWSTASDANTTGMFGTASDLHVFSRIESLSYLVLGEKFRFRGFPGLRSPVALRPFLHGKPFCWIQVNLAKNGSAENPEGRTFYSLDELIKFHHSRQEGSGPEAYVCAGFGRTLPNNHEKTGTISRFQRSDRQGAESIRELRAQESSTQVPDSAARPKTQEVSTQESNARELSIQVPDSAVRPETQEVSTQESNARESSTTTEQNELTGWYKHDNMVFYYRDGRKLTGWQELRGIIQNPLSFEKNWFYFDGAGVMLTGRHKLFGGFKNAQGVQEQHWFALDGVTGAQIRYWQRVVGSDGETWYYQRPEDGSGLLGKHQVVGGFANARGVHELNWFYFDTITGAEIRGWHKIIEDGIERWCYYRDGDGIMLKGQHRLLGGDNGGMNWFYFDEITGEELRSCWKDIPSQGKTCYYGCDGVMYKGWRKVDDRDCYFDKATGALV